MYRKPFCGLIGPAGGSSKVVLKISAFSLNSKPYIGLFDKSCNTRCPFARQEKIFTAFEKNIPVPTINDFFR